VVRALVHVGMALGGLDERAFEAVRRVRERQEDARALSLADFKQLVREQFFMLLIDAEQAMAAIPGMLPEAEAPRRTAFAMLCEVLEARGPLQPEAAERLGQVRGLFGLGDGDATAGDGGGTLVRMRARPRRG
jgi:hypothetical protein